MTVGRRRSLQLSFGIAWGLTHVALTFSGHVLLASQEASLLLAWVMDREIEWWMDGR